MHHHKLNLFHKLVSAGQIQTSTCSLPNFIHRVIFNQQLTCCKVAQFSLMHLKENYCTGTSVLYPPLISPSIKNNLNTGQAKLVKTNKDGHLLNLIKFKTPVTNPRPIHTSSTTLDVMDFFDNQDYWGAAKVRVGRSWLQDELRLKSNEELHKLWFVLLKERNMLLTMQEAYKEANKHMPNEERIDKVQESMENLEEVVRERNRAYFELETGGSGERERVIRQGPFGLPVGYAVREHALPYRLNTSYRKMLRFRFATSNSETVRKFVRKYMEKKVFQERWNRMKQMRRCANLLKRFPDSDEEALKEKFPLVDIPMVKRWKRVLGHHHNLEYDIYENPNNPYGNK